MAVRGKARAFTDTSRPNVPCACSSGCLLIGPRPAGGQAVVVVVVASR